MMTVKWTKSAKDDLTTIWIKSEDRNGVTQAAIAIEKWIQINPLTVGESRTGTRRTVFHPPLAVTYEVVLDDLLVRVLGVKSVRG